jgi:hypothetical protein
MLRPPLLHQSCHLSHLTYRAQFEYRVSRYAGYPCSTHPLLCSVCTVPTAVSTSQHLPPPAVLQGTLAVSLVIADPSHCTLVHMMSWCPASGQRLPVLPAVLGRFRFLRPHVQLLAHISCSLFCSVRYSKYRARSVSQYSYGLRFERSPLDC